MIWDLEQPCATCPYRRESKRALWAKAEFDNLQAADADPVKGAMFGCHSYGKEPVEKHRPCVGWLLDQKRRNTPSIRLRLALMTNAQARALYERISDKGLSLYRSIQSMVRANYPPKRRRTSDAR